MVCGQVRGGVGWRSLLSQNLKPRRSRGHSSTVEYRKVWGETVCSRVSGAARGTPWRPGEGAQQGLPSLSTEGWLSRLWGRGECSSQEHRDTQGASRAGKQQIATQGAVCWKKSLHEKLLEFVLKESHY